jgi:septum formation protein
MQSTIVKASLVLASGSPRRRELLDQIGVSYHVIAADIDESCITGERPDRYVERMAREKAWSVKLREECHLPVLAADTAVVIEGHILGKPGDRKQAGDMLRELSACTHEVWSAVALVLDTNDVRECINCTQVTFAPLSRDWIEAYCATSEPMDKSGAYGVQGRAAQKISRLEGSYSSVMGLPLFETSEMLSAAGLLKSSERSCV